MTLPPMVALLVCLFAVLADTLESARLIQRGERERSPLTRRLGVWPALAAKVAIAVAATVYAQRVNPLAAWGVLVAGIGTFAVVIRNVRLRRHQ